MGKHGKNPELRNRKKQQSIDKKKALEVVDDASPMSETTPSAAPQSAQVKPQPPQQQQQQQLQQKGGSAQKQQQLQERAPTPQQRAPREPVYDSDGEEIFYSDDEGEGEEDPLEAEYRNFVPPADLPPAPVQDDMLMLVAVLVGFFLALLVGVILPRWGVPQQNVMGSGMATLFCYLIYLNFCTCKCCRGASTSNLSPIEQVTPQMVFIVAASIGTMLGGMIGGAIRHVPMW